MGVDIVKMLQEDLDLDSNTLTENIKLLKIQYLKKSNKLKVILKSQEILDSHIKGKIRDVINKKLQGFCSIELICYKDISNVCLEDISNIYWIELTGIMASYIPVCREFMEKCSRKIEGNLLKVSTGNEFICNVLKNKNIEKLLCRTIGDLFGVKCSVDVNYDEALNVKDYLEKSEKEEKKYIEDIFKCRNENFKEPGNTSSAAQK